MTRNWKLHQMRFYTDTWTLPYKAVIVKAEKIDYIEFSNGALINVKNLSKFYPPSDAKPERQGSYWDVAYIIPEETKT